MRAHHSARSNLVKLLVVGASLRTRTAHILLLQIKSLALAKNTVWLGLILYHEVPHHISATDICTIPFSTKHPTAKYSKRAQTCGLAEVTRNTNDYQKIIQEYIRTLEGFKEKAKYAKELAKSRAWTKLAQKYEQILL